MGSPCSSQGHLEDPLKSVEKRNWIEVPRDVLVRTASIIGEFSAAALALKEADTHDGPVKFYQTPEHNLIVEKIPRSLIVEPA